MKRIEKIKKTLATLLAMVLVLGMSVTAQAENHMPVSTDSAEITVLGVKTGATVKAYKIAEGKWNENGFIKYEGIEFTKADGGKIKIADADLKNPKAEDLTAIANIVKNDPLKGVELDEGTKDGDVAYRKTLEVGMYLVLVTKNGQDDMTAYNPMLASVYYSSDKTGDNNDQIGGEVNAGDDYEVEGSTAWAKSMNPGISKEIVSPKESDTNKYGNDTAIGTEITFEVKTSFPGYSDEYTEVEFDIVDTLSDGMDFVVDGEGKTEIVSMLVGGDDDAAGSYTVTNDGRTMTINFTSAYILAHRGEDVVVQYKAKLNGNAGINFDKNTNTVKAEYTNNPTTKDKGTTEEKRTYHYTFGIDASINGSWDEITKELLKTGEEVVATGSNVKQPLDGATFTLTSDTDSTKVYTTISGKGEVGKDVDEEGNKLASASNVTIPSGYLKFTGLDAGKYTLQETKAPKGYSLNDAKIPVEITAEYNDDGTLKSYTITVDGTVVEESGTEKNSSYTAEYQKETNGEMTIKPDGRPNAGASDTQEIPNTKIIELPSTGGIGTTIFTIGGCAIMIIAAGLYFASRRKKTQ